MVFIKWIFVKVVIVIALFGNAAKAEQWVSFESLNNEKNIYENKNVIVNGYVSDIATISLLKDINGNHDLPSDRRILIDSRYKKMFESLIGCYVFVNAYFKRKYTDEDIFYLTGVKSVGRDGLLYHLAKNKMKENDVSGEPKCESDVLIELMAQGSKKKGAD